MAYWIERVDKILSGEDEGKGCLIRLEVVDAILETADSGASDDYR
jgi:hypothetical protein